VLSNVEASGRARPLVLSNVEASGRAKKFLLVTVIENKERESDDDYKGVAMLSKKIILGCMSVLLLSTRGAVMDVKKVIIPAAGLGTRFFPWSRSMPKELLPLGDAPAIEHVVREAIASGCTDVIMIAGARKYAIIDYFEKANLPASFTYVPQPEPKGLGHAISMAAPLVKDEYVGIILPDELLFCDTTPGLKQLIEVAQREKASVVGVSEVPREQICALGCVAIKNWIDDKTVEIATLVEKPKFEEIPSNLALNGRYVLSPKLFESLKAIKPGAKGEYQLTDAIAHMLAHGEKVIAYKVDGTRHDIGNPKGWIKAVIASSLDSKQYNGDIRRFMEDELMRRYGLDFLQKISKVKELGL